MGSGLADLDFLGTVVAIIIWLLIPGTLVTLILFLPALLIRKIFHLGISKLKLFFFSFLGTIAIFIASIPFLNYILPWMGGVMDKVF